MTNGAFRAQNKRFGFLRATGETKAKTENLAILETLPGPDGKQSA